MVVKLRNFVYNQLKIKEYDYGGLIYGSIMVKNKKNTGGGNAV